jgi:nucleotide-binding universal stress UspA family protein
LSKSVLIPLDGTKAAERALEVTTLICEKGDSVVLFSAGEVKASPQRGSRPARTVRGAVSGAGGVADIPRPDLPVYAETEDQTRQEKLAELTDYLEGLAAKLREAGHSVEVVAELSSDAAQSIVDCARRRKPTFIAMVRSSHKSLAELAFGTVAQHVVRSDVAPVIILPST